MRNCLLFLFLSLNVNVYSQQKIKDFYLSNLKEKGTKDWEMKGKEAVIYDENIDIEGMRANYYSEDDTINITSDKAKMNKVTMDGRLLGNVRIKNKEGMRLSTDSLSWQRQKNHIETDDWVKISRGSMQIEAEGLSADTQIRKADFKKNVEIIFIDEETKDITIVTCRGPLNIEYNLGKAVFNQDVVVTNPQGKLVSDKVTLFFDVETKQIVKIISERYSRILNEKPHLIYYPDNGIRAQ